MFIFDLGTSLLFKYKILCYQFLSCYTSNNTNNEKTNIQHTYPKQSR